MDGLRPVSNPGAVLAADHSRRAALTIEGFAPTLLQAARRAATQLSDAAAATSAVESGLVVPTPSVPSAADGKAGGCLCCCRITSTTLPTASVAPSEVAPGDAVLSLDAVALDRTSPAASASTAPGRQDRSDDPQLAALRYRIQLLALDDEAARVAR